MKVFLRPDRDRCIEAVVEPEGAPVHAGAIRVNIHIVVSIVRGEPHAIVIRHRIPGIARVPTDVDPVVVRRIGYREVGVRGPIPRSVVRLDIEDCPAFGLCQFVESLQSDPVPET